MSRIVLFTKCSGDLIKKNEMGRACGTYGGEERCIQVFGGDTGGMDTNWKAKT
jgi:hypothetical protein